MLIILPDPTTRSCWKHPHELMTDSIPCMLCEVEQLCRETVDVFVKAFEPVADALREALRPRPHERVVRTR